MTPTTREQLSRAVVDQMREWPKTVTSGTLLKLLDAFAHKVAELAAPPVASDGCEACRGTEVVPVWDSGRPNDWHQQTCPVCSGGAVPAPPADAPQEQG